MWHLPPSLDMARKRSRHAKPADEANRSLQALEIQDINDEPQEWEGFDEEQRSEQGGSLALSRGLAMNSAKMRRRAELQEDLSELQDEQREADQVTLRQ